jgi:hypothetical protein
MANCLPLGRPPRTTTEDAVAAFLAWPKSVRCLPTSAAASAYTLGRHASKSTSRISNKVCERMIGLRKDKPRGRGLARDVGAPSNEAGNSPRLPGSTSLEWSSTDHRQPPSPTAALKAGCGGQNSALGPEGRELGARCRVRNDYEVEKGTAHFR